MARTPKHRIPQEEKDKLESVLKSFSYSRAANVIRYNKFRDWLRLYHQIPTVKSPFRSNLFVPLVYPIVSTVLPRMVSNKPSFRYEPRTKNDEPAVKLMKSLVDFQLDEMDFTSKLKMWVKDTLIFGTGIAKCYWKNDGEYEGPWLEVADPMDFYPDPKAAGIQGGDFVIHRTISSLNDLKKMKDWNGEPLYQNLDNLGVGDTLQNRTLWTVDKGGTQGDIDAPQLLMGTPFRDSPMSTQIEVLEYQGVYEGEEWIITVANRTRVIRALKNPYECRTFIQMQIDPVSHEFWGKGLVQPIEHLQLELNDKRNQRMDNVNLILNKQLIVLRGANVDEQELISRPGGVIYEDINGAVRWMETPDVTASGYKEESMLKDDAQNAVGVSDIVQGNIRSAAETPGTALNKTATGVSVAVEQSGSRFRYYLQNIEDALRELGKVFYEYNQAFLANPVNIRASVPLDYESVEKRGLISKLLQKIGITKEQQQYQFQVIDPDAIKNANLTVKVEAGSTKPIEEQIAKQNAIELIGVLGQLPVATPETYLALAENILDAWRVNDKERIMQTFKVPQGAPKTNVSVSLRGDLNEFQAAEIARQAGAVNSTDPALTASLMAQDKRDTLVEKLIDDQGTIEQKRQGTIPS